MIMTDHPAWITSLDDTVHRAVDRDGTAELVIVRRDVDADLHDFDDAVLCVDPAALAGPDDLVGPLKEMGPVARLRNPSLWNAVSSAVMRQVIRATTARATYARFCAAYGEAVDKDGFTAWLFPRPERVLELSDEEFSAVGAAFPREGLRSAARSYLTEGPRWEQLPPVDIVTALQTVPRIGPWTAKTAAADYTNDFSLYDYSDIAVQPAAHRLNSNRIWPKGAPAFKAAWEEVAGNQLSEWTILTLTWGSNYANLVQASSS